MLHVPYYVTIAYFHHQIRLNSHYIRWLREKKHLQSGKLMIILAMPGHQTQIIIAVKGVTTCAWMCIKISDSEPDQIFIYVCSVSCILCYWTLLWFSHAVTVAFDKFLLDYSMLQAPLFSATYMEKFHKVRNLNVGLKNHATVVVGTNWTNSYSHSPYPIQNNDIITSYTEHKFVSLLYRYYETMSTLFYFWFVS